MPRARHLLTSELVASAEKTVYLTLMFDRKKNISHNFDTKCSIDWFHILMMKVLRKAKCEIREPPYHDTVR